MDFSEAAARLFPMWMMGITMLALTWNSKHRNQLKVDTKGLVKFAKFMAFITLVRLVAIKFLAPHQMIENIQSMVQFVPWQATLGVFWEDACHTLPLALLAKMYHNKRWYKWAATPLLGLVMFSFGSGHMYQGLTASIMLSFYIPFTLNLAKKYGFGTIMICHILYDLITILSLKWLVGA